MTRVHRPTALVIATAITLGGTLFILVSSFKAVLSPQALSIGIGFTAVFLLLGFVVLRRSRLWHEGLGAPLLVALAWGGLAATGLTLVAAIGVDSFVRALEWEAASASFGGAWPEEIAKGLGVVLILLAYPAVLRRPQDGLLIGIAVGAGFELIETIQYGLDAAVAHASSDLTGAVTSWSERELAAGVGLHAWFTGLAGWGLGAWLGQGDWRRGLLGPLAGFVLHFAWNYYWPAGLVERTMAYTLWGTAIVCIIFCWRSVSPGRSTVTSESRQAQEPAGTLAM